MRITLSHSSLAITFAQGFRVNVQRLRREHSADTAGCWHLHVYVIPGNHDSGHIDGVMYERILAQQAFVDAAQTRRMGQGTGVRGRKS